jgi:aromatic-L-amino-acid/L-tryptophan decarboxylase
LREALGLPEGFTGVIQDSSSSATLVSLLTAREVFSKNEINRMGFAGTERFRVYTSSQAHSSVDKGVRIAGFGIENLVKIAVDTSFAMRPEALEAAIQADLAAGCRPFCVVSTIGTTSSTAIDPIRRIGEICRKHGLWHHIDASYAGTALLLPEMRWMGDGIEWADSFVFNPHKWMFTHFDCSAYFVRDKDALTRTFSILPEYLKTQEDKLVNNYRDWGIPLGRRFRALKLWFVMRSYGMEAIRAKLREHIAIGQWLKMEVEKSGIFEIMAPVPLNLICFRLKPKGITDEAMLNQVNEALLNALNNTGKILLTQTKLDGKYVLRFVAGQTHLKKADVVKGWKLIRQEGKKHIKNARRNKS